MCETYDVLSILRFEEYQAKQIADALETAAKL